MNREQILQELRERFGTYIVDLFDKSPRRVYLEIDPAAMVPAAGYIFKELRARFNIASAMDARTHTEILYHFSLEDINLLISLRVKLDREKPSVDSLAPVFRGAAWIEREMSELLGIEFRDHPDMRRLLLADEWPQGVYPLRADYREWDENAVRDRGV
jgi:Ni,Fe-hydrogenase III component G